MYEESVHGQVGQKTLSTPREFIGKADNFMNIRDTLRALINHQMANGKEARKEMHVDSRERQIKVNKPKSGWPHQLPRESIANWPRKLHCAKKGRGAKEKVDRGGRSNTKAKMKILHLPPKCQSLNRR